MIAQPARIVRGILLVTIAVSCASGCASQQTAQPSAKPERVSAAPRPAPRAGIGERAARVALQQVGTPYRYGGSSPSGFDCSGLVHYSYANVGKSVPRTTGGLWEELAPVDNRDMRAGDLLFFRISGKMSHVGLYLGAGRFVHAPSSGKVVSVETLTSDYYRQAFIRAGRPQ
jgi:cell wall-associated NlpC family hydrolase